MGFNFFSVFLVDLMHEFELGVWKRIFTHLLRILECVKGATNQLNQWSVSFLDSSGLGQTDSKYSQVSRHAYLWP